MRRTKDLLPKHLLSLHDHGFDEFAGVACGVEEGDGGGGRHGKGEGVGVGRLGGGIDHGIEVGHEEAGKEEGGGNAEGADVGGDGGFAVEVEDVGVFAGRQFGHV